MKVAHKILLIFVTAAVLVDGGGSFIVYSMLRSTLTEETNQRQMLLSESLMSQIDSFLYERQQSVKMISQAPLIVEELMVARASELRKEERRIRQYFDSTGPWDRLIVVDAEGRIHTSSPAVPEGERDVSQTASLAAAFNGAMEGRTYYSDATLSPEYSRPTMVFANPIRNVDEAGSPIIGAVIAEVAWPAVTDFFAAFSQPQYAYLFDRRGVLIASNFSGVADEILQGDARHDRIVELAAESERGYRMQASIHGQPEVLAAYVREAGYLSFEGNGWILLFETPVSEAFASMRPRVWGAVFYFSAIVLSGLVILYAIVNRIMLAPINEVAEAIRKRTKGDRNVRIKVLSNDEIGQLSSAFNGMADTLNGFYRNLEQKVRARTKSLAEKNAMLEDAQVQMAKLVGELSAERNAVSKEKSIDEAILAGIGDGVFVLDLNRRITLFNHAAERITGFSADETIGRPYADVLRFTFEKDGAVNDRFINEAIAKGTVTQMANHTLLERKDGIKIPVADSAAAIKLKDGSIFGCVVVFRDVTKEREIDQMKSEFVSVASHQLRTPLTGIKWFTELLLKRRLSKANKEYVDQISASNERMVRLVDDLLNVSRIETGRKFDVILKETDVVPVFKSVIEEQTSIAAERRIALLCSRDAPKKLALFIDELKIRQVMQNLISNAIKYSKENTQITVGCTHRPDEVVFYVKDQGIGIPAHQQEQVFKKFFRAENVFTMHTDGTGLGLYICKAIVEAHGGKIWFESEESKGSTFYFSLPLHRNK